MGLHDDPPLDRALTPDDLGTGTEDSPRLTVEVWLPLQDTRPLQLLMMLRSPARGAFWQCVSGRVEATDATLRDAAVRELREETGLVRSPADVVDLACGYAFFGTMSGRPFRKRSVAIWLPGDFAAESVALSEEHVEAKIVAFDEARTLLRFDAMKEELDALRSLRS